MKYFVRRGKSIRGPYSIDQIRKQLKSKTLKHTDRFAESKDGPWTPISSLLRTGSVDQHNDVEQDFSDVSNDLLMDYLPEEDDYSLPPARKRKKVKHKSKANPTDNSRYPALHWFKMIHRILGWLTFVACIIATCVCCGLLVMGLVNKDAAFAISSGLALGYTLVSGLILAVYLWAIADGIQLVIDIESGIRKHRA